MTDARCEPPPELRGKDGEHWVQENDEAPVMAAWNGKYGMWLRHDMPSSTQNAHEWGWRYLSPVLTPAEVEALRQKYQDDMHAAIVEVGRWSQRSGLQDAELTTLRGEVEKLKRLLEECANDLALEIEAKYAGADKYPSEAKRRDRDMEIVNLARAALEPQP